MDQDVPCPGCGTQVPVPEDRRPATFPFCSARCRVIDLGAWASERYSIAGRPGAAASDADQDDEPR